MGDPNDFIQYCGMEEGGVGGESGSKEGKEDNVHLPVGNYPILYFFNIMLRAGCKGGVKDRRQRKNQAFWGVVKKREIGDCVISGIGRVMAKSKGNY